MEALEIERLAKQLIAGNFTFETEDYSQAINKLVSIYKLDNALYYLKQMASSDDYSIIFALSFILEHYSKPFINANKDEVSQLTLQAINKGYCSANCYLLYPLVYFMEHDEEYLCFLELLHNRQNTLQNDVLRHLYYFDTHKYEKLNRLSEQLDFSLFYSLPSEIDSQWFEQQVKGKSLLYQKVVSSAVYKKVKDKKFVHSLTDMTDAELFDFIYIWLPDETSKTS
ncbi:hypothetical protein IP510_02755 [Psychrobacter sp. NG254]|uniref:hypothetical protein n=1 Tax=Psychrobacter sp. NG254 TaxID=2782003 RepID=UPI001888343D|nr:hypothetical protein [Psychrobacter sp. NG254]MBF2718805.1 hypothetical protein [Psychrobacter sp. NG254]